MDMNVQLLEGNMLIPACNEVECVYFTWSAREPCPLCVAKEAQDQFSYDVFEQTDGPDSDYQECSRRDCYNEVFDSNNSICNECQSRSEADQSRLKADYYRSALVSILHSIGSKQDDNTDDWIDDLIPTITAISQDATYWHNKYMNIAHPDREDKFELVID
jgi:hypothetical protein